MRSVCRPQILEDRGSGHLLHRSMLSLSASAESVMLFVGEPDEEGLLAHIIMISLAAYASNVFPVRHS